MSKKSSQKKENQKGQKIYYDTRTLLIRYIKRYGLVVLISSPFIMIFNYLMGSFVTGWNVTISVLSTLVLLLFVIFLAIVFYTKKDRRDEEKATKENQRDPFAD